MVGGDGVEQALGGVIEASSHVTISLSVGSPQHDHLITKKSKGHTYLAG